jgi:hypothetical protein
MTFTVEERKMIEGLRKRERLLRQWRWPLVLLHGGMMIACVWLMVKVGKLPDDDPAMKALVTSYVVPGVYLLLAHSTIWFGYVISRWKGDAKTHLLLRLIDEREGGRM